MPSDARCRGLAQVLTAAAQTARRRLHIKSALAPAADGASGIALSESDAGRGNNDLGAHKYREPARLAEPRMLKHS